MSDTSRDLEIRIKALNLTQEAFLAVKRATELLEQDTKKSASGFSALRESINRFAKDNEESLKSITKAAALAGAGVAAVASGVIALGIRGSTVLSVERSFQALARSVGDTGDEILRVTRGATKGLISDMDVMSAVNKGILLGLPLTSREMGTLATTAIVLGKAMQQGPTESLNDLIVGLGRGSPLILDNLGITINAAEAYKAYGAAIGKSADDLTDGEKKLAIYRSALDAAGKKVADLGGLQLTFADRIQQGRTRVDNMVDSLGKAVAVSPAVNAALDTIMGSTLAAFGVTQQDTVQRFAGHINRAAIVFVDMASAGVSTAKFLVDAFYGVRYILFSLLEHVTNIVYAFLDGNARISEFLAKIPVFGSAWKGAAENARYAADLVNALAMSFEDTKREAGESLLASDRMFDALRSGLDVVRAAMVKATAEAKPMAAAVDAVGAGAGRAGAAGEETSKQIEAWGKKARELDEVLRSAARNNVDGTIVLERYGNAIAEVAEEGDVFGRVVPEAIRRAYAALKGKELAEAQRDWIRALDVISMKSAELARKQIDEQMKIAGATGAALSNALATRRQYEDKLADLTRTGVERRLAELERERRAALDKLGAAPAGMEAQWKASTDAVNSYYDALVRNVGDRSGEMVQRIRNVASILADAWGGIFGSLLSSATAVLDQIVSMSSDKFSGLAGMLNSRTAKAIGIGLEGFGAGYGYGAQAGKAKGAAAGAASGFLAGAAAGSVVPGVGTVIGGVIGAAGGFLGGLFGGAKKSKQDREELAAIRKDLVESFGSMEALRKSASSVGVSLDRAFSTKKPAEARAEVERLSEALEAQRKRLEGVGSAIEAINARAAAAQAGLMAGGERASGEFARIGAYAAAAFAGTVRETGDALGALQSLEPTFAVLAEAQRAAGFEASATLSSLLEFRSVVSTNRDVADSLSGLNQIMRGLGEAGITNRGLFQTFGEDAGAQIRLLTERNVDLNSQMQLMQPTLQALWEGQQRYGAVTDESTAALLRQAEEQGIVGANMRDVNERILDVLLAIGDALGARLPAGLAATQQAATATFDGMRKSLDAVESAAGATARTIEGEFSRIQIQPIDVPYAYRATNGIEAPEGGGDPFPGFAVGGSVPFTPGGRVVRVAERETERIVSDRQLEGILTRALAASGGSTRAAAAPGVIVKIGERELRPMVVQYVRDALASGEAVVPRRNLTDRGL